MNFGHSAAILLLDTYDTTILRWPHRIDKTYDKEAVPFHSMQPGSKHFFAKIQRDCRCSFQTQFKPQTHATIGWIRFNCFNNIFQLINSFSTIFLFFEKIISFSFNNNHYLQTYNQNYNLHI